MPLGTIDRTPPPFFRQGPSALSRLVFYAALALFAMGADTRWQLTQPLRAVIATGLLPVQQALNVPVRGWAQASDYLRGLSDALASESRARARLVAQAEQSSQVAQLAAENARLRALLELKPALAVRSIPAEVLYEAPDPYSRKLLIDRGARQGIVAGSPVMNENGVLGQVTRVYPLNAEVLLLVDKDAAIPVMNSRTQARSAAFGAPAGAESSEMELRFMPGNADVQTGDLLVTSGVDGIYPPGLSVARIARIDRQADSAFARIALKPTAPPDGVRHVLVLQPLADQLPPWPADEAASGAAATRPAARAVAPAALGGAPAASAPSSGDAQSAMAPAASAPASASTPTPASAARARSARAASSASRPSASAAAAASAPGRTIPR